MNKELINKAIKERTLRLANLPDLAVGTKVVSGSRYQGEALAHYADQVVFGWSDGGVNAFDYDEHHYVYLAPLCFVESKPVYKGDVLYSKHGGINKRVISHAEVLDNPERFRLVTVCGLWEPPEKLSWTKPVTTININGYEVPMPERELLKKGSKYYVPSLSAANAHIYFWDGDIGDTQFLERGLVHLTPEAATAHAEALVSFTKKK